MSRVVSLSLLRLRERVSFRHNTTLDSNSLRDSKARGRERSLKHYSSPLRG
jgi:hypothetical protein